MNNNNPNWRFPTQQPVPNPNRALRYEEQANRAREEVVAAHKVVQYHKNRGGNSGVSIEPGNVSFATQNPDEKIFVYLRRHWSENISWILRNIFYAFIPFILAYVVNLVEIDTDFLTGEVIGVILLFYYSLIVTNVIKDFADWYFDPYIITNERIIKYDFKPFSKYEVKETMLESIQEIKERAGGLLSNIYGYGNLVITIEGPQEQFVFEDIPNPTKVRDILSDLIQVARTYDR